MEQWERRHNIWEAYREATEKRLALMEAKIASTDCGASEPQSGLDASKPTSGNSLGAATATPNGTPTF